MSDALYRLVLQEARFLDEGRLDDWLALYSEDATYWIPIDETADPLMQSSVVYDTRERLAMRVDQIMREDRVAQSPPSETLRMVSNFSAGEADAEGATASYALLLTEMRGGDWRQRGLGELRMFPAHCHVEFRKSGADWKIRRKKIVLLNRHRPIEGLSFII